MGMQFYLDEKDSLSGDWDDYIKEMNEAGNTELLKIQKEYEFFMD
jgi:hypothetical protein